MIEEFDAYESLTPVRFILFALALLLIAVVLEIGLRLSRRWAVSRQYTWVAAILNVLTWRPLFWALLIGVVWPVSELINTVAAR